MLCLWLLMDPVLLHCGFISGLHAQLSYCTCGEFLCTREYSIVVFMRNDDRMSCPVASLVIYRRLRSRLAARVLSGDRQVRYWRSRQILKCGEKQKGKSDDGESWASIYRT